MPDLFVTNDGQLLDFIQSGLDFLAAVVTDNLLNMIMTDLYSPSFGTDLKMLPSTNLNNKKELEMKLALYIERIEQRIKEEQAETPSDDDEEMLENLKLISLTKTGTGKSERWEAIISITALNGAERSIEATL